MKKKLKKKLLELDVNNPSIVFLWFWSRGWKLYSKEIVWRLQTPRRKTIIKWRNFSRKWGQGHKIKLLSFWCRPCPQEKFQCPVWLLPSRLNRLTPRNWKKIIESWMVIRRDRTGLLSLGSSILFHSLLSRTWLLPMVKRSCNLWT